MQRTDWAEQFAAQLASRPLVHECVFVNPKYFDRTEKEVCDLIFVLKGSAILIQMKCQKDPQARLGKRLENWVRKVGKQALGQLQGALGTVAERDFWCQHPRRGRVEFEKGKLSVVHGIVLVETWGHRVCLGNDSPILHNDVPISYLSVNDFLNLVNELRAFPEILSYLQERRTLPVETQRTIGGEQVVMEYYLLNKTCFPTPTPYEQMEETVRDCQGQIQALVASKRKADTDAHLIEYVADSLATRSPTYLKNLPSDLVQLFDDPSNRSAYLRLQDELCDLRLPERRVLGRQFRNVISKLDASNSDSEFLYGAAIFDSKPDFVYVLVAARNVSRDVLLKRGMVLLRGALATYSKPRGMFIADRDTESFEVGFMADFAASDDDKAAGKELFGSLKISTCPSSLVTV